jgi:ATP-binding cassette subfamily B protein
MISFRAPGTASLQPPPVTVLSVVPGRIRWSAPMLRDRRRYAEAVAQELAEHSGVHEARTNPLTGSVLLCFDDSVDADTATRWVVAAIDRHARVLETPRDRSRGASTDLALVLGESRRRHDIPTRDAVRQLVAVTDAYPALRRRAVAASVADGLADGIPPLLVGLAVGTVTQGSGSMLAKLGLSTVRGQVLALAGIGAAFWGVAAVVEYWRERSTLQLADRVRRDLRVALYRKVQSLDVATVEGRDISEWMAVLGADVDEVARFIHAGTEPLVVLGANVVIVGATFAVASPVLGVAQLAVIPPLVLASRGLLPPIRERHRAARDAGEQVTVTMGGNLRGIATLLGFNAEAAEVAKVERLTAAHVARADDATAVGAAYVPTLRAIVGAGFVTTLAWGAARVHSGAATAAGLDTMAYTQLRLMAALARVGVGVESFQRTAAALQRIHETLALQPSLRSGTQRLPAGSVRGELRLEDVTFGYDPARPILDCISLHVPAGSTVGIVGPTGAGKSTLLKLLLRFYDPQVGQVMLDGTDVRTLQLDAFRRCVAVVPQEVTLFSGTIHENIALGEPAAGREAVEAAARAAAAHDFITRLPQGYDTVLGHGGHILSGGQRQRLAIARALLVQRPLLLFDEATSSLDHATEAAIQHSLRTSQQGRTMVIVAHRLSTVRHADRIIVMDDGRIVEAGTHDALLAARGVYASMWNVQTGAVRVGDDVTR